MTRLPPKTQLGVAVGHLYPFISGCGTFANGKLMRRFDPINSLDITVAVKGGRAHIPTDDYVGRAMMYLGDLDRKISALVDAVVEPGNTVLDIGANLGLVSLRLAGRVGKTGAVHAFEPSPRLAPYLSATLAENPDLNIKHHRVALGIERTLLPLHIPAGNAGAATLRPAGATSTADAFEVQVHPLSDYAEEVGIDRVDFVKIDVEGFEEWC